MIYNVFERIYFLTDLVGSILFLVMVGLQIPLVAALVRRLHDIDKEGGDFFVTILPIVGWVVLFVWLCRRGTVGDNRFGPDPLAPVVSEAG